MPKRKTKRSIKAKAKVKAKVKAKPRVLKQRKISKLLTPKKIAKQLDASHGGLGRDGLEYLQLIEQGCRIGVDIIARRNSHKGTVYPILHRLEATGFITSQLMQEGERGPPRRVYSLSAKGRRALRKEMSEETVTPVPSNDSSTTLSPSGTMISSETTADAVADAAGTGANISDSIDSSTPSAHSMNVTAEDVATSLPPTEIEAEASVETFVSLPSPLTNSASPSTPEHPSP